MSSTVVPDRTLPPVTVNVVSVQLVSDTTKFPSTLGRSMIVLIFSIQVAIESLILKRSAIFFSLLLS